VNQKELDAIDKSVNFIWLALHDCVETGSSLTTDVASDAWMGTAYAGRPLLDMYVELVVKCSEFISQSADPAFRCGASTIEVLPPGVMLGKVAQIVQGLQGKINMPLDMMHPTLSSAMHMFNGTMIESALARPGKEMVNQFELTFLDILCLFNLYYGTCRGFDAVGRDEERAKFINSSINSFRKKLHQLQADIKLWEQPILHRRSRINEAVLSHVVKNISRVYILRMEFWIGAKISGTSLFALHALFVKFQNNLRFKKSIFKRLHGILWCLEQLPNFTYRYHCLFFLDGGLVGVGEQYADLIGEYWQGEITDGIGRWHDWGGSQSDFCRGEIGVIDLSDYEKRAVFSARVFPYFTDFDLYVRRKFTCVPSYNNPRGIKAFRLFGFRRINH
jgi:hypothetical protein